MIIYHHNFLLLLVIIMIIRGRGPGPGPAPPPVLGPLWGALGGRSPRALDGRTRMHVQASMVICAYIYQEAAIREQREYTDGWWLNDVYEDNNSILFIS